MRLFHLRLFCVLLAGTCCLQLLPGQESSTALKPRIKARHIKENVLQVYRAVPALKPPDTRSKLTERKAGEAHLVPVTLPVMTPARFEGKRKTINLPATFSDVVEGGGGRFLIFYLRELKQMAIFDVSAARIVKYLPLDSDNVAFAASADKLVIVARDKSYLQRYDLLTFKLELTKPLPEPDVFYKVALGSASNGPLLLCTGEKSVNQWLFYDLATLEPNGMQVATDRFDVRGGPELLLRASANGRLFTLRDLHHAASLVVNQKSVKKFRNTYSGGYPLPSADGKTVYLNRRVFNNKMKPLSSPFKWMGIPSSSGDFFLTRGENFKSSALLIMQPGESDPLLSIPEIGEPISGKYYSLFRSRETGYRLYLAQKAKALVFLPADSSKIVLYRFDFDRALEESENDYFIVTSQPPDTVDRGASFKYAVKVKSRQPQVKFNLNLGPEGMKVSPEGLVEWQVPRDISEDHVDVVLSITSASGKEILQTFPLEIQGKLEAAPHSSVVSKPPVVQKTGKIKTDTKYSKLPGITPVKFAGNQKQYKLPTAISDLVVGGGGRYLILFLKDLKKLAVFDTSKASIVEYLPVESKDILFAASGYHLMVLLRDKMLIQRWNLLNLERELMIPVPTTARISGMVMGSASHGPLVLFCEPGLSYLFLDPDTMQPLTLEKERESYKGISAYRGVRPDILKYAHASADGQVIAVGESILVLKGSKYERLHSPLLYSRSGVRKNNDYGMRPSTNGKLIYAPLSVYNQLMNRVSSNRQTNNLLIPATQPGYYLSLIGHYSRQASTGLALCLEEEAVPFTDLKKVDVSLNRLSPDRVYNTVGMPYLKRYTLVPDANLLIQIPTGENRLILHKVNLEQLLVQFAKNYLFVSSRSVSAAHIGQTWEHQVAVKSKQGGVQYELSSGPDGVTVSPQGLVTWKVPSDFAQLQVQVVLNLQDRSGKKISHTVTISIPEAAENAARIAEEHARLLAEKNAAIERKAKEERKKKYQRKFQRGTSVKQPTMTTAQALKIAPFAKAKADANAKRMFEQQVEAFNLQKLTQGSRTWTDEKGNQFEAQLTRVFAGNAFFSSSIMKQDRTNFTLKVPLAKLSSTDRTFVSTVATYRIEKRKLLEAVRLEKNTPRYHMSLLTPGMGVFSRRSSEMLPAYSVDSEGKPLLSWRVQLLPYVGGHDLYRLFRHDEPWNSEHNRQLIPFMPDFYRSPDSKADAGKTNLLGVSGEHCLFSGKERVKKSEITDGVHNTALLVEVPDALAVEWTKPTDWEYSDQNSIKSLFGFRTNGFYVLFADGRPEFISGRNTLSILSRLFTRDDGLPFELK